MAIVTLGTKLPESPPPTLRAMVPYYQWTVTPDVVLRTPNAGYVTNIGMWARFSASTWKLVLGVYAVTNGVPTTLLAKTPPITPAGAAVGSFGANMGSPFDWVNTAAAPGSTATKLYLPANTAFMFAFYVVGNGSNSSMWFGSNDTANTRDWFQKYNTTGLLENPNAYTTVPKNYLPGIYATFDVPVKPTAALTSPADAAAIAAGTNPTFSGTFATTDATDSFSAYEVEVWLNTGTVPLRSSGTKVPNSTQISNKTWAWVYDGPTTVEGQTYKWRARVQALAGGWSDYTAFRTFTPPITDPTGSIDLLTGAVPAQNTKIDRPDLMTWAARWIHNLNSGMDRVQIQIRNPNGTVFVTSNEIPLTVSPPVPSSPPGKLFTVSQIEQQASGFNTGALPSGRTFHAYLRGRATSNQEWTSYAGPLIFRTNALAGIPAPVAPADESAFSTRPELVVRGYDPDPEDVPGSDTIWQFEILRVSNNSSVITNASSYVPAQDLALSEARLQLTTTEVPAIGAYRWRSRSVEAAAGPAGTSAWTAWQDFQLTAGPQAVITSPLPDEQVPVGVVRIAWTISEAQKFYQVQVFQQADNVRRYVTTVITSPDHFHDIPLDALSPNVPYYVRVSVWNLSSVQGTSEDVRFTIVPGAIVALQNVSIQVLQLSGDVEPTTPVISWARSAQPTDRFRSYLVRRYVTTQGRASASLVAQVRDIAQLSLRDYHAPPGANLTYLVSQQGVIDSGAVTEGVAVTLATRVDLATPMIVSQESPEINRFPVRHQQAGPPAEKLKARRTVFQTWGAGGVPTVVKAPGAQENKSAKFTLISDDYGSADAKRQRVKATIAAGALVSYRNGAERLWVDIADNDIAPGDAVGTWEVSLALEQMAYREARG